MNSIVRLGGSTNAVVVQLPERQLPGIVIQRDSLRNLSSLVKAALGHIQPGTEAADTIEEVAQILDGYLLVFEQLDRQ